MLDKAQPLADTVTKAVMGVGGGSAAGSGVVVGVAQAPTVLGVPLEVWTVVGVMGGLVIGMLGWMTNVFFKIREQRKRDRYYERSLEKNAHIYK